MLVHIIIQKLIQTYPCGRGKNFVIALDINKIENIIDNSTKDLSVPGDILLIGKYKKAEE